MIGNHWIARNGANWLLALACLQGLASAQEGESRRPRSARSVPVSEFEPAKTQDGPNASDRVLIDEVIRYIIAFGTILILLGIIPVVVLFTLLRKVSHSPTKEDWGRKISERIEDLSHELSQQLKKLSSRSPPNESPKPQSDRRLDDVLSELKQLVKGIEKKVEQFHMRPPSSGEEDRRLREREEFVSAREAKLNASLGEFAQREAESRREFEENERQKLKMKVQEQDITARERNAKAESQRLEGEKLNIVERENTLRKLEVDLKAQQEDLHSQREAISRTTKTLEQIRHDVWPRVFIQGPLCSWRERIEADLGRKDPVARALWLAIGRFAAMVAINDEVELRRSLLDLGRWAYKYWSDQELDKASQTAAAREWASALEDHLGGDYRLRIAEPGAPKDRMWMTFSAISGGPLVTDVLGWCILNKKNIPLELADVA